MKNYLKQEETNKECDKSRDIEQYKRTYDFWFDLDQLLLSFNLIQ